MLTAALDGLVARFGLPGRAARRGRRRRGAQARARLQPHPRGRARLRAVAADSGLRRPAGLRHRPRGRDPRRQQDRARPDRVRHRRRRRHHARRADRASTTTCASVLLELEPRQDARQAGSRRSAQSAPGPDRARRSRATPSRAPACRWASTRRSPPRSGTSPARSRTSSPPLSHRNLAAAYDRGFFDDLVTPYLGLDARPEPAPGLDAGEAGQAQAGVRQGRRTRR